MCSRYEMNARPADLVRRFRLAAEPDDLARAEIRPTDPAPIVIRDESGSRRAVSARFGLAVSWGGKPILNARIETLTRKPTFRNLLRNRCLVPATGYFEWRHDGRARLGNRISFANSALMAFAGLHDGERFVIVTRASSPEIARIHDRMPAILPPEAEDSWLDADQPVATPEKWPVLPSLVATEEIRRPAQGDLFAG